MPNGALRPNRDNRRNRQAAYLTKRATAHAARKGFAEAARETMQIMGYNVIAQDGWVVKIDKDGRIIERISQIQDYKRHTKTRLD